jgi:uncharacterized protein (DUF1330 family)
MYIHPTKEAGAAFFGAPPEGPVVMLNLLRFREVADYSKSPHLAPASPVSGEEAYRRYAAHTMPLLQKAGSEVLLLGKSRPPLIGPTDERWDLVLLVRHRSAQAFLAFATDEAYLAGEGHRTAALADSRLLPITEGF